MIRIKHCLCSQEIYRHCLRVNIVRNQIYYDQLEFLKRKRSECLDRIIEKSIVPHDAIKKEMMHKHHNTTCPAQIIFPDDKGHDAYAQ